MRMPDDSFALLPNIVALQVERQVTAHRRARKVLFENKPANWPAKLRKANDREHSFVCNKKTGSMASSSFLKRKTTYVDGCLQVIGSAKAYEVLRVTFSLDVEASADADLGGPGKYFLSSANFARKQLACVKATEEKTGWDILKEIYAGRMGRSVGISSCVIVWLLFVWLLDRF